MADRTDQKLLEDLGRAFLAWSSVIELIGTHERGYLDHCRRYAMGEKL